MLAGTSLQLLLFCLDPIDFPDYRLFQMVRYVRDPRFFSSANKCRYIFSASIVLLYFELPCVNICLGSPLGGLQHPQLEIGAPKHGLFLLNIKNTKRSFLQC